MIHVRRHGHAGNQRYRRRRPRHLATPRRGREPRISPRAARNEGHTALAEVAAEPTGAVAGEPVALLPGAIAVVLARFGEAPVACVGGHEEGVEVQARICGGHEHARLVLPVRFGNLRVHVPRIVHDGGWEEVRIVLRVHTLARGGERAARGPRCGGGRPRRPAAARGGHFDLPQHIVLAQEPDRPVTWVQLQRYDLLRETGTVRLAHTLTGGLVECGDITRLIVCDVPV